jgi:hypothetical protein
VSVEFAPVQATHTLVVPTPASTTTYGTWFQLPSPADRTVVVASLVAGSASKLNVYLQESWDGGVTATDVLAFAQLNASTSAQYRVVPPNLGTIGTVASGVAASTAPTLTAGTVLDQPWGPLLRIVSVTGTGTNSGAVTQSLNFIPWQSSH